MKALAPCGVRLDGERRYRGPMASRRAIPVVALAFVGLVATLIGACGGASPDAGIESIDRILVGEIQITELSATGAVMRVETAIPVACSVVFGPDTDYGTQSTDVDMAGRAHRSHAAPLFGLEANTVYHYRVQGTGPDGTIYVSEDRIFRTPAAEPETLRAANLATLAAGARVARVSSEFGGDAWQAANAIDDDPTTAWSSAGDGDAAFLEIVLAEDAELEAIGVWTRTMGMTAQIQRFRVVTDRGEVLGPFDLPAASELFVFPVATTARTLRFEVVTSTGGNTGLVEFAAYGRLIGGG